MIEKEARISDARMERGIKIFMVITALVGLAMGLSDAILANYFYEAYQVTALERGIIEFPRELPGVLVIFAVGGLAFLGNIRSGIIAQVLTLFGLLVLTFTRPDFNTMLIFLFIYSLGMHMYLALGDSIGLSLTKAHNTGRVMGRISSARMASLMVAALITFFGFRFGAFSFETPIGIFLLAAIFLSIAAVLLVFLYRVVKANEITYDKKGLKIVLRKNYLRYYIICALFGARKQIMFVYSPWILVSMLGFPVYVMAILGVIGSFVGIFFLPLIGRCIDRYGIRRVMVIEAIAFMGVYIAYASLSGWLSTRPDFTLAQAFYTAALGGILMILAVCLLSVIDRVTAQFGIARSIYLKSVAISEEDVMPSIAMGMSIDHVFAIVGAVLCGLIWYNLGPQYVFMVAALMSLINVMIARGIKPPKHTEDEAPCA